MRKKSFFPFILTAAIVVIDQISKAIIVARIPENQIGARLFSDYLWIIHVRNNAVAFSMGTDLSVAIKYVLFLALPIIFMALVAYAVVSDRFDGELSSFERWCLAGILGGGLGNIIDRLFRNLRVVDWISTATYGFMGMDRWPTYNIADASVVVSVILLLLAFVAGRKKKDE